MRIATGIVAHISRMQQTYALMQTLLELDLGIDGFSLDDGTRGVYGNHRHILNQLATIDATHALVLEDDALPCANMRDILIPLIEDRPTHLLGLYVGTRRPTDLQRTIGQAIKQADRWLPLDQPEHLRSLRWGVGYVIPTADIPAVIAHADALDSIGADRRIGRWHGERNLISYPWPSLVDHDDGPSARGSKHRGLKAWATHPLVNDEQPEPPPTQHQRPE
jgi:hypothetical protein